MKIKSTFSVLPKNNQVPKILIQKQIMILHFYLYSIERINRMLCIFWVLVVVCYLIFYNPFPLISSNKLIKKFIKKIRVLKQALESISNYKMYVHQGHRHLIKICVFIMLSWIQSFDLIIFLTKKNIYERVKF